MRFAKNVSWYVPSARPPHRQRTLLESCYQSLHVIVVAAAASICSATCVVSGLVFNGDRNVSHAGNNRSLNSSVAAHAAVHERRHMHVTRPHAHLEYLGASDLTRDSLHALPIYQSTCRLPKFMLPHLSSIRGAAKAERCEMLQ